MPPGQPPPATSAPRLACIRTGVPHPLSFTTVSCLPTPNGAWPAENGRPMDRKAERDGRHHQRLGRHGIHRTAAGEACVRCVDRGDGHDRCAHIRSAFPAGSIRSQLGRENAVIDGMTAVVLLCPPSFGVGSSIAGWRPTLAQARPTRLSSSRWARTWLSVRPTPDAACMRCSRVIAPLCCRLSRARSVRCAAGAF